MSTPFPTGRPHRPRPTPRLDNSTKKLEENNRRPRMTSVLDDKLLAACAKKAKIADTRPETMFTKHMNGAKLESFSDFMYLLQTVACKENDRLDALPEMVTPFYILKELPEVFVAKEVKYFQGLTERDGTIPISFNEVLSKMFRLFALQNQTASLGFGLAGQVRVCDESLEQLLHNNFDKDVVDFVMCRGNTQFIPVQVFNYLNNNGVEHECNVSNVFLWFCCASWFCRNKRRSDGSVFVMQRFDRQVRHSAFSSEGSPDSLPNVIKSLTISNI